jgi:uncharacterized small protein (DUF1192 family)
MDVMTVTEAERHRLYETFRDKFGQTEADTFMKMQVPIPWNELATKTDLLLLGSEITAVKSEIAGVRAELGAEIAGVRAELKSEIAGVTSEIAGLRAELKSDITGLSIELTNITSEIVVTKTEFGAGILGAKAELGAEIASVKSELTSNIAGLSIEMRDVEARLLRTFGTWLFASQAAVITAMGVMLALLR